MIKKSKVTQVTSNGSWEGKYGTMFKFEVSFENGDTGEYSSKSKDQTKFVEGELANYEFVPHEKWPKVKPITEGFTPNVNYNNSNKDELICRQNALTSAVRSLGEGCKVEEYVRRAEIFKQYTFDGKTPEAIEEMTKSDLPF